MLRDGANGAKRAGEAVGARSGDGSAGGLNQSHQLGGAEWSSRLSQPDHLEPLSLPRLSAEALAGLGRDELTGVLGDIERLANRLAGYRAEVLGALEVLNQTGEAPDPTPYLTLRDAAGVSERDARQMIRAAEKARSNEPVLEALSGGDINPAQAETLCDARVPDAVRAGLVAAAAGEDTDATRHRVRQAETDHCVETPTERFERQRQARGGGMAARPRGHAAALGQVRSRDRRPRRGPA